MDSATTCLVIDARRLHAIRIDGPALKVTMKSQSSRLFPLRRLSRVHVIGTANMGLEPFLHCAERQVPVAFFTVKGKLRCQLYFPVIANTLLSHWFEHVEFDCDIKQLYERWLEGQTRHILAQLNVPRGCPENASAQLAQQMRKLGRKSLGSDRWDSAMDWLAGMLVVQLSQVVVEYGLANQSRGKRKLLDDIGPVFSLWLTARFVSRIAPYKRRAIDGVSMSAFYQEQSQGIDYMIRRMLIQLITRLESIV